MKNNFEVQDVFNTTHLVYIWIWRRKGRGISFGSKKMKIRMMSRWMHWRLWWRRRVGMSNRRCQFRIVGLPWHVPRCHRQRRRRIWIGMIALVISSRMQFGNGKKNIEREWFGVMCKYAFGLILCDTISRSFDEARFASLQRFGPALLDRLGFTSS